MSENGEIPKITPMDHQVDHSARPAPVPRERVNNVGVEKLPIADQPQAQSSTDPAKLSSLRMAEIERNLADGILRPPRTKADQFALSIHRKSDMRLKGLSRQLGLVLKRDHADAMTKGPISTRIRDFDIQAQSMRMVSANAALGTYQFQKNLMLPYMRKSLALGYQKVSLLKDMVSGIGSLEKAVVSKLEAIKINTAATAPRKQGFFKRLWNDISFLNMRRISGNVSNFMMNGWDKRYRKYVSPVLNRTNEIMRDDSPSGGVNGVARTVTNKLNNLRRTVRNASNDENSDQSNLGRLKTGGAKAATRILDGVVRTGQKIKLSDSTNRKASGFLQNFTDVLSRFQPFAAGGNNGVEFDEEHRHTFNPTIGDVSRQPEAPSSNLAKSFSQWRQEYRSDHDKIIGHLSQISEKMAGCCEDSGFSPRKIRSGSGSPPIANPTGKTTAPVRKLSHSFTIPPKISSLADKLTSKVTRKSGEHVESVSTPVQPDTLRPLTPIEDKLSPVSQTSTDRLGGVAGAIKKAIGPIAAMATVPMATASPQTANAHVETYRLHNSTQNLVKQADVDRAFITKMVDRLGDRIGEVSQTIDEGNDQRTRFEKIQTRWKEMADRLRTQETRQNSYEDILADREKNRKEGPGLLGRTANRAKGAALGAAGSLAAGNVAGAAGGLVADALGWAKDELVDGVTDKASEKIGDLIDRRSGKAPVDLPGGAAPRRSLKRRAASLLWRGTKGAAKFGAGAAWGLTKFGTKAGWGLTKYAVKKTPGLAWGATKLGAKLGWGTAKLGAKAGWGATKFGAKALGAGAVAGGGLLASGAGTLLRGGASLAKASAPGLAVGIGADFAQDWINKNTTGKVKQVGNTAAEMAKWGATGATIGSLIPGLGTVAGGAAGAAIGAVVANADIVSSRLSSFGNTIAAGGSFLWTSVFGQDAKMDKWGRVKQKEKLSLFGNMKASIFGSDTKYSKSGEIVREGNTGLIPGIRKGFNKFLFGDMEKDGSYKKGTSIVSQLSSGLMKVIEEFKTSMMELPGKIADGLKGLGEGAMGLLGQGGNWISEQANSFGSYVSGGLSSAMDAASNMLGMSETSNNAQVKGYLQQGGQLTSVDPAVTAWCAAFVNATLAKAGIKGSGSLAASSFKNWGNEVRDPRQVQRGDVLIEDKGAKPGQSGDHVGLATGEIKMGKNGEVMIEMLSGNSSNKVTKVFYSANRLKIRRGQPGTGAGGGQPGVAAAQNNPWSNAFEAGKNWVTGGGGGGNPWSAPMRNTGSGFSVPNYASGSPNLGPLGTPGKGAVGVFNDTVNYLTSKKGWSRNAAIGIAANLFGESNLNPQAFNGDGGGQGAKGIAQWRGSRITDIEQRSGKPIQGMSLYEQLDAVDWELRSNKHITNSKEIPNGSAPIVDALNGAPNMESVIQQMVYRYERPGSGPKLAAETQKRIRTAYSIMGQMGMDGPKSTQHTKGQEAPKKQQQANAKPAGQKAPAPKTAPKAPEQPSWYEGLSSSMSSMTDAIKGMWPGADTKAPTPAGNTTVVAPIIASSKGSNPAASVAMNMRKTVVRTGS